MRRIATLPALLALAACAGAPAAGPPVPVYLKPSVSARQALEDVAICREEARRAVPRRSVPVSVQPTISVGVSRCSGRVCVGASQGLGGGIGARVGPLGYERFPTARVDRNAPLRGEAIGACMGAKGYGLTTLPRCTGPARALQSHPFDTTGLCVARGEVIAEPV
ncbi:hypothetical protein [Jannaschia sp. W003]|uniref:hypothetical protein n=1 Tax=Jannaschia sp. W003 TaxID=2867012 RepID=UPI0021A59B6A|nr:hypothetical protein [Jannaschia sp. W003]UWQ20488.1 hypothetical protein K3554_10865 [Jannaschia sp. W003]